MRVAPPELVPGVFGGVHARARGPRRVCSLGVRRVAASSSSRRAVRVRFAEAFRLGLRAPPPPDAKAAADRVVRGQLERVLRAKGAPFRCAPFGRGGPRASRRRSASIAGGGPAPRNRGGPQERLARFPELLALLRAALARFVASRCRRDVGIQFERGRLTRLARAGNVYWRRLRKDGH